MSSAEPAPTGAQAPPVALVDLGDTLCDCTTALRAGLDRLRGAREDAGDEAIEPPPPPLDARRRLVMATPGFWRALAPLPLGFELMQVLREEGFAVHVVTKGPRDVPQAWADKVSWCREHLPDVPVVVTDDKSLVHGHVLVDDWLPYVAQWQRRWSTSLAIVPAQPWNVQATTGPRLLRYDGRNRCELRTLLRACRRSVVETGGPGGDRSAEATTSPGT